MLQPFPTVEAKRKYDSPHCPVSKHSNPYSHWAEASETDQIYTKAKTECPHSDTGCDHGKSYITGCTKSISRNKCHCPHKRFYNRDPHYHMETHICTLFLHTAKNGNRLRQCKYHKAAYQYYDFCNHTIEIMEISIGPLVLSCARKIDAAESYAAINGNDRAV